MSQKKLSNQMMRGYVISETHPQHMVRENADGTVTYILNYEKHLAKRGNNNATDKESKSSSSR